MNASTPAALYAYDNPQASWDDADEDARSPYYDLTGIALAPFLALADELAAVPDATDSDSDYEHGNTDALKRVAVMIRRIAGESA